MEKTDSDDLNLLLTTAQKLFLYVQKSSTNNNTIEISTPRNADGADEIEPLRAHEIVIVICVLLLWFVSIFIFIRHSNILRIRHRDIPYHSTAAKTSVNMNHAGIVKGNSDAILQHKSRISSAGGITPPGEKRIMNEPKVSETIETISLSISPSSRKRRYASLLDKRILSITKNSFDKHDDKEQLLDPRHITTEIKENLLDLQQKSIENLSTIKHLTFRSINDVRIRQPNDSKRVFAKKRCIQESPV
ncbi:unnamed protein product [Adineta ricciae]|uniref:Uncharacterized protein n=1 Tax=Adineta ricciae TaxID=249248 RepID=A0A815EEY3_ADIRI|nr:unnamed protein product [Adineta ricciae]CAF1309123.1 unnamed protein product [Adineta ricciae]